MNFGWFLDARTPRKSYNNKKRSVGGIGFLFVFLPFLAECAQDSSHSVRRGRGSSTIIIFKEIIRFNNHLIPGPPRFLPTRSSSRRGLPPPLRGGSSLSKESPVLPIPSYPALCRKDTTSWNDGRPRTLRARMHDRLCGPIVCLFEEDMGSLAQPEIESQIF